MMVVRPALPWRPSGSSHKYCCANRESPGSITGAFFVVFLWDVATSGRKMLMTLRHIRTRIKSGNPLHPRVVRSSQADILRRLAQGLVAEPQLHDGYRYAFSSLVE